MKTYEQCCNEIAKVNKLGDTLVTGHKAGYFKEAALLYAREVVDEILTQPDMIYVDDEEAVYSYSSFEEFKKSLK